VEFAAVFSGLAKQIQAFNIFSCLRRV